MIVVGEKLNSSIPSVNEAFARNDADYVKNMAQKQLDCGADYLDVNTAVFLEQETDKMLWLIGEILKQGDARLMIDSPNPSTIKRALEEFQPSHPILNSITLQPERFDAIVPLVCEYHAKVVALPIDQSGMPESAAQRFAVASELIEKLKEFHINEDDIFIDCLVQAVSSNHMAGLEALRTIRLVKEKYPAVHVIGGLSNVSFGLPKRVKLNSAFLTATITAGLDSAIMDITSPETRFSLYCALLLNGQDEYCAEYLQGYRDIF